MRKKIAIILSCLAVLAVLNVLLFQPKAERFRCEHCDRTVTEKPIHIAEQSVDMTICSDCYQDYIKGMWKIWQS